MTSIDRDQPAYPGSMLVTEMICNDLKESVNGKTPVTDWSELHRLYRNVIRPFSTQGWGSVIVCIDCQ